MVKALLFGLLGITFLVAVPYPWIGVLASYLMALLTPQHVWHWHFEGLRAVAMILAPTFLGFGIKVLAGRIDYTPWFNKRVLLMLILWIAFIQSYYLGPYVNIINDFRFTDSAWAFSIINKILLMWFIANLLLDTEGKLWALAWMVAGCSIYLIYWANVQYLTGNWLNMPGAQWGRLSGPTDPAGKGPYLDENNFALFFVITIPILWHLSLTLKDWWWRVAIWLIIPLGWHAIFLAGSRGGLLGLGIVTLVIGFRSKYRKLGLMLLPALAAAYMLQAGDTMKSRATTIDDFRTERSAATRIEAWTAAMAMMRQYPLTGVGIASFGPAFPTYSDYEPREAHNTFFQISAEIGVAGGLAYLALNAFNILAMRRNAKRLKPREDRRGRFLFEMNEAALASSIGFFVCSMFLSLQLIELFYFLCLFVNITNLLSHRYLAALENEGAKAEMSGAAPAEAGETSATGASAAPPDTPERARNGRLVRPERDRNGRLVRPRPAGST
jgi:O-antigen ligase